jgi:hypothetical protein
MKFNPKCFICQRYTRRIDVWGKIWRPTSKCRLFMRKQYVYFGFSKQNPLTKSNVYTEFNMETIHLQMMLSDFR